MENKTIKIVNMKQATLYVKNGLLPLQVCYDKMLVFEFDMEESRPLYTKWLNKELK